MFFKKGLRDLSLIHKLAMKYPKMFEEMLAIANKCALAEEATIDTKDQKKDKEHGHLGQPNTLKSNDTKRKSDHSMANVEWPCHNMEYQPWSGEFEGFLDRICIFHPQRKHRTRDCDRLQGFVDEALKMAKMANQEKKPEEPKADFPKAHKEVNYIYGGLDSYESRRKPKLTT
jgi:hypothetical protein